MKTFVALALVALASSTATDALAANSASGSIHGVRIELIDLDTGDGIAPGYSWIDIGYSQFQADGFDPYGGAGLFMLSEPPFAPDSLTIATTQGSSFARVAGDGSLEGTAWSVGGQADGADRPPNPNADRTAYNAYAGWQSATLLLSANTRLVLSALVDLDANLRPIDGGTEYVVGGAAVSIRDPSGVPDASYLFLDTQDPAWAPFLATPLSIAYDNTGASSARLQLDLWVNLGGVSTSVVPEPGGWALMLTGASVCGVLARRRRRSALRAGF